MHCFNTSSVYKLTSLIKERQSCVCNFLSCDNDVDVDDDVECICSWIWKQKNVSKARRWKSRLCVWVGELNSSSSCISLETFSPETRRRCRVSKCDQMVRLFFNIWPFATMKISPIMSQICQSQLSILPNNKWTVKTLSKTGKLLPKWRNFARSGHTGGKRRKARNSTTMLKCEKEASAGREK